MVHGQALPGHGALLAMASRAGSGGALDPPGGDQAGSIATRLIDTSRNLHQKLDLTRHEVIVSLIGSTSTRTGLSIHAAVDLNPYPTRLQVSEAEMEQVQIERHAFHGEWNYTIAPKKPQPIS